MQQPSLKERYWSALQYGCLLQETVRELIQVIRRVDGNVVPAVFHSSLFFATGVYWRKTTTSSINVLIVRNCQEGVRGK